MKILGLKTYMTRVGARPRLLVKVETDEGISGWGEAYNHGPDRALVPVLEYLFDQIRGVDPRRIEFIVRRLLQSSRFPPGAIGLAAISAIDHALWDISGKAAGLPVYMLLGGNVRDRVRVYCGIYSAPDPKDCLERTQEINMGVTATPPSSSPRTGSTCTGIDGASSAVKRETTSRRSGRSARRTGSSPSTRMLGSSSPTRPPS